VSGAPLTVRITNVFNRIRRVDPAILDVILASCFVVIVLLAVEGEDTSNIDYRDTDTWTYVLAVATALPYYFRRRAPLPVLVISTLPVLALCAYEYPTGAAPTVLLVGTYTVAAYCDQRQRAIGAIYMVLALTFVAVVGTPDLDGVGVALNYAIFAAAFFFGSTIRNRRLYTDQLEQRAALAEREREEEAKRAVSDERLRIAQELHDVVAHSMGVIAVQAGVGAHVIDKDPAEAKKALEAISTTSRGTLVEIRRILGVLREDDNAQYQPAPGLANLDWIVRDMASAGIEVDVTVQGGEDCELPPGVDLTAFRIVQEALTNVLKHAGPAKASVLVAYEPEALRLEIVDDGRGVNGRASGGGHGLLGMRERVGVYGGAFEAGPRAGGGFKVAVRLPYGSDG
jgi:signal transduction histidine kinase